jgi:hypothetical protein
MEGYEDVEDVEEVGGVEDDEGYETQAGRCARPRTTYAIRSGFGRGKQGGRLWVRKLYTLSIEI